MSPAKRTKSTDLPPGTPTAADVTTALVSAGVHSDPMDLSGDHDRPLLDDQTTLSTDLPGDGNITPRSAAASQEVRPFSPPPPAPLPSSSQRHPTVGAEPSVEDLEVTEPSTTSLLDRWVGAAFPQPVAVPVADPAHLRADRIARSVTALVQSTPEDFVYRPTIIVGEGLFSLTSFHTATSLVVSAFGTAPLLVFVMRATLRGAVNFALWGLVIALWGLVTALRGLVIALWGLVTALRGLVSVWRFIIFRGVPLTLSCTWTSDTSSFPTSLSWVTEFPKMALEKTRAN